MDKKRFPRDFQDHKILKKFTKPRAIDARAFVTNDPSGWFVKVLYYKKKSGEVKDIETIIAKDVPAWTNWFQTLGWKEED